MLTSHLQPVCSCGVNGKSIKISYGNLHFVREIISGLAVIFNLHKDNLYAKLIIYVPIRTI